MKYNLVIPAAGIASRLKPITNNQSKVMVNINGKPCLEYIFDGQRKEDVEECVIVTGFFNDVENYLKRNPPSFPVSTVKQDSGIENLKGPKEACYAGISSLKNKTIPLVIWLGDTIILDEVLKKFLGKDCLVTSTVRDPSKWCIKTEGGFFNKPTNVRGPAEALVGVYSLTDTKSYEKDFALPGSEISEALDPGSDTYSTRGWYDIGNSESYYNTCADLLSMKSRVFNFFEYDKEKKILTKFPNFSNARAIRTIKNERFWYQNIPEEIKPFTPRIFNSPSYKISMEYTSGSLVSDLILYSELSVGFLENILRSIISFIENNNKKDPTEKFFMNFGNNSKEMWENKTRQRMGSIPDSIKEKIAVINSNLKPVGLMHGDLHLGNVLYDYYIDKVTYLDPRGEYGEQTIQGDNLYDLGKLGQDIFFGYNFIVQGYSIEEAIKKSEILRDIFYYLVNERTYSLSQTAASVLLFNCIPLHNDCPERQEKLLKLSND